VVRSAISGDAPHELEFAVGRDEADRAVDVELAELDALMELAVVQLDRLWIRAADARRLLRPASVSSARSAADARFVNDKLVLEPELAFWRPAEVCAHQDLAIHVGAQDVAWSGQSLSCAHTHLWRT